MNYLETFNTVNDTLGNDVAILTCVVGALHLVTDPTEDEYTNSGAFLARIKTIWYRTLWEENYETLEAAIKAWIAFCDYEQRQSLAGLGGCEAREFKVIYNDPKTYDGWDLTS